MTSGSARAALLNRLNTLLQFGVVGDLADAHLVQRFLTARDGADQAAFTALVERHGPMVLGVCQEVLGDSHDAQDAFQATFLVLARKAGSVRKVDSLASWLHGVARRVAIRAKAGAARRRVYERRSAAIKAADLERPADSLEQWSELHDAIARLPKRYREPVVLFYLEGLTTEEVASRIGCPMGTISSRLSRARERLRAQLERRGLTSSTVLFITGLTPRTAEALPARLLDTTVRAAFGFVGRLSSETGLASVSSTTLAQGVLHTMTFSKLKIMGVMALTCGFAWGGVRSFGQFGGLGGILKQVRSAPDAAERKAALTRSVDKLQAELDESVLRTTEMQKRQQDIRAELKALLASHQQSVAAKDAIRLAEAINGDSVQAARRLADALKRHSATSRGGGSQSYMLDLVEGELTLIADEPAPGLNYCGMAKWSHDGSRILFQAGTGPDWPRARIWAIEVRDGRPTYTDLGDGNDPTFSPDDKRIAFLLHAGNEAGAGGGVWMMHADGSERHHVGDFGSPFWSQDGREFLINSYSLPTTSSVINVETKERGVIEVLDHQIFSWPSWAGPGTVVTALAPKEKYEGDAIALLDVHEPAEGKILEILWKRTADCDVTPRWPVFRPGTRQCFFEGVEEEKRTIYSVERGESMRAKHMGVVGHQLGRGPGLGSLAFSPDGRYLLLDANQLVQNDPGRRP